MRILIALFCSIFAVGASLAAVPLQFNHQGRLFDNASMPLDTTVDITFSLYAATATNPDSLTEEELLFGVQVQNGYYSVILGRTSVITPEMLNFPEVYLGVKVGNDSEMTPRIRLVAVPYAVVSEEVEVITVQNVKDAIQEWAVIPDADQDGHVKVELGGDDCDDWNPYIHPGAADVCDGIDNNCDGIVDNGTGGQGCTYFYIDVDGDGYGSMTDSLCLCSAAPPYTATNSQDCDDLNPEVNPGATEICNGIDDDCDAQIDPPGTLPGATRFYEDQDNDGFGSDIFALLCNPMEPYTALVSGDCDDFNAAAYPGATEICDGIDNDCNAIIDDDWAVGCTTYFMDQDNDGFGNNDVLPTCLCAPSYPWTALVDGDCNDTNASINPAQPDGCDGIDNNCNGEYDEDDDCPSGFHCEFGACVSDITGESINESRNEN